MWGVLSAHMNIYYEQGIVALRQRDYQKASYLLVQAVKQEPDNVMAWLWLAKALPDRERRRRCIERALELDPNHAGAQKMLVLHEEHYENGSAPTQLQEVVARIIPGELDDDEMTTMLEAQDAPIIDLPRPSRPRSMGKLLAEVELDATKQARRVLEIVFYLGLALGLLVVIGLMILPLPLQLLAGIAAVVFLVYGFHHLVRLVQDRPRAFKLYQYGIEQNNPHRRWLWYDFIQLRQVDWQIQIPLPGRPVILLDVYGLTLQSETQKTWLLTRSFADCRDVGETIMARTEAMWVERDYEAVLRGESRQYSQTILNEMGIQRGNVKLTWDEVDEIEQIGQRILIRAADGRTIRERFRGTWNAHILIGLVERMIEARL